MPTISRTRPVLLFAILALLLGSIPSATSAIEATWISGASLDSNGSCCPADSAPTGSTDLALDDCGLSECGPAPENGECRDDGCPPDCHECFLPCCHGILSLNAPTVSFPSCQQPYVHMLFHNDPLDLSEPNAIDHPPQV